MATLRADWLTNTAYGFPRGAKRRITPRVLAVVHITANLADAQHQRDYANRAGSNGPSAHYYIDRNGDGIHAIDESSFAAWSNGDIKSPNLANLGVKYLHSLTQLVPSRNVNEGCYLEIECVGTATIDGQWTEAQFDTVAHLIANASLRMGIPISDTTVLPHAYINTIDRPHCPSLHIAAHMTKVITLAKGIGGDVTPAAITDENEKLITVAKGAHFYDLDGTTILTSASVALTSRLSPYGTSNRRAMFSTIGGLRRIVLVVPATTSPVPAPSDCSAEIAAAITADRAKAHITYE
jgi:N-acetylmuramoyl-L-alanine amidase